MKLLIFIVLALIAICHGHNWINSASRSPKDNTVAPALPSATGSAHVQVILNQPFQVEWQQGHEDPTYFILVKKADYNKLNNHKDLANLDKYLDSAGATKTPPSGKWQKYHRTAGNTPVNEHGGKTGYFKSRVANDNANYIERSEVFENRFKGYNGKNTIYQWIYPDECRATDRRTFHTNSEFPWIVAMWRFKICEHEPARADVALFNVPGSADVGEYVLHYRWRGYYDVIDVEVVAGTTPVALPYGKKPDPLNLPPPVFQRIPHCEFKNPANTFRCMRVVASEKACVKRCGREAFSQCNGVNVVRLVNGYPSKFKDVNIPFDSGDDALCDRTALVAGGLTDALAMRRRTKICYGLVAGNTPGIGAYYITNDPEDPAFFSTCHVRVPPVIREGAAPAPEKPPTGVMPLDSFVKQGYCMSACSWGYRNRRTDVSLTQVFRQNRCDDCRRQGTAAYLGWPFDYPTSTYTSPRVKVTATNQRLDGVNNQYTLGEPCPKVNDKSRNCVVRVMQYASGPVQMDALIADTVELMRQKYSNICSNIFTTVSNQTNHERLVTSFCLRKTPACCLNTKYRTQNAWQIHEVDQAWLDMPFPE